MSSGGVADNELGEDEEDGGKTRAGDSRGGSADESGEESLKNGPKLGRARLNEDEPEDIADGKEEVNRQEGGAGKISKEDEGKADDKVDEIGL